MVSRFKKRSSKNQLIATERIDKLFALADDVFSSDSELANRYITLARKLSMKFHVKLKSEYKRKFCSHCYIYLRSGINCRVRTSGNNLVYTCFNCKKFSKFGIK